MSVRLVYPGPEPSASAGRAAAAGASPRAAYPTDNTNRILIRVIGPHIPVPMEGWFSRSAGRGEISGIPPGDRIAVEVDEYDNTAVTFGTSAPLLGRGWVQGISLAAGEYRRVDVPIYARGTIVRVCGAPPSGPANTGTPGDGGDGGLADNATLNRPLSVELGPPDEIYVASSGARRIRKIDRYGYISHFAGNGGDGPIAGGAPAATAPVGEVFDMDVDGAGHLYLVNVYEKIVKIDRGTGTVEVKYDPSVGFSAFVKPDIAVAGDNAIFYSNAIDNVVYLVQGGARISYVGGQAPPDSREGAYRLRYDLRSPSSVSYNSAGPTLFFCDYDNRLIKHISWIIGEDNVYTTVGNLGGSAFYEGIPPLSLSLRQPRWAEFDRNSHRFFFRENYGHAIRMLLGNAVYSFAGGDAAGYSGDGGPATAAQLNNPSGVAVDSRGNVYIADTDNHALRMVVGGAHP